MQNNIGCIHFVVVPLQHYKDVVKRSNVAHVGHKLIYAFLALSPSVLIQKYLHVSGLDLDLGLEDLASTFWLRLTFF